MSSNILSSLVVADSGCYHCGLPVPAGSDFRVKIQGVKRDMCCPGCEAVASAIVDGGLGNFYRFRTQPGRRPDETPRQNVRAQNEQIQNDSWDVFDLDDVQTDFVVRESDAPEIETPEVEDRRRAQLLVEGITCAACVWLIEHQLQKIPGVITVKVNAASHRCSLVWDAAIQPLSALMRELSSIGYKPQPATDDSFQALWKQENRQALMRLGVAGFGMMQVGMVAVALYAGGIQGISENWQQFLRWLSLVIASPVVLYSARPFFSAALRSVKAHHLSMDVPVSLAIGGAFAASCWATLTGSGEVYFDSVSMFTFFLLLGRYFEMRARHRNNVATGNMAQLMPLTARRLVDHSNLDGSSSSKENLSRSIDVPVKSLKVNDWVLVKSGDVFPCDGLVKHGQSTVVEALLTGESNPVAKHIGDTVAAGTLNTDSSLVVEVTAVGQQTQLSGIERLVNQASEEKPAQVAMADRLAGYFVAAVLLVSVAVAGYWYVHEPSEALWITLSVLVVTCPCALSLATPAAVTAATASLRHRGLLLTRGHVIESLHKVTRVVFDKTGTLTLGELRVEKTLMVNKSLLASTSINEAQAYAVAAALESTSSHPIAHAFTIAAGEQPSLTACDLRQVTAAGVEGKIDGVCYRLGALDFVEELFTDTDEDLAMPASNQQWLLLGSEQGPLAWFGLSDQLRDSAVALVKNLQQRGIAVELLSGDKSGAVAALAQRLGIDTFTAGALPDEKLARVRQLQSEGEVVLMVGDGINDVPVLSGADISIAMGSATDLAQTRADSVLLNGDLTVIDQGLSVARQARRIISQNLSWALAYNGLALPLAAAGWVPPYLAAIGMSASSLVVIVNALRLGRH